MMTIREYKRAESLEEAWQLNQKKPNRILGGMIWLKMETINVGTAIDLSGLGLDKIEETAEGFSIGAMVPLRQIELHEGLNAYTDGAVRESVRHIVGVQLRNLATVGGSLLVVSQFTLYGDTKKGYRPSFIKAAKPPLSVDAYELFLAEMNKQGLKDVQHGEFGADMQVALVNEGPCTIIIDTDEWKKKE